MKDFIPYQEALELKELGFDEPCFAYFEYDKKLVYTGIVSQNKNSFWVGNEIIITAPTYSQAFRWFREKYKLHSSINLGVSDEQDRSGLEYDEYIFVIEGVNGRDYDNYNTPKFSKSPEEAELACLRKLIEIVKNKQHE